MYARVWKVGILPGKVDEFTSAANDMLPILRGQFGFRGCVVLRSGPGEALEATVVSMWDTIDALRNSETAAFQLALDRFLAICQKQPSMREEEVLVCEIPVGDPDDTITKF
jgi:heme-degrading monooxygenase HmoA